MKEKIKEEIKEILEQLLLPELLQVLSFSKGFVREEKKVKEKE